MKTIDLKTAIFEKERIQTFDKMGKIYIPVEIRKKFKGCYFYVMEVDGKIVLEPIKIE